LHLRLKPVPNGIFHKRLHHKPGNSGGVQRRRDIDLPLQSRSKTGLLKFEVDLRKPKLIIQRGQRAGIPYRRAEERRQPHGERFGPGGLLQESAARDGIQGVEEEVRLHLLLQVHELSFAQRLAHADEGELLFVEQLFELGLLFEPFHHLLDARGHRRKSTREFLYLVPRVDLDDPRVEVAPRELLRLPGKPP
jgi:hypothetical protein